MANRGLGYNSGLGYQAPTNKTPKQSHKGDDAPGTPTTPSGKSRIDPTQVPRPQAEASEDVREFRTRSLSTTPVPQASSSYKVIDDGNCNPRFMRMSLNQIPSTRELATRIAIPIAVVIQPMAELPQTETQVPFVTDLQGGPIRCRRCRCYVNCHVQFVDGGRHWVCNLCGMMNGVEPDFFCTLDAQGRRRDANERPELSLGSYDVQATQEYFNRPATPPAFMFCLDVSKNAVQSGLLHSSVQAVLAAVDALAQPSRAQENTVVGVMTYDMQLHFYNLASVSEEDLPGMLVVPDIDDPFVPSPNCMVKLNDKRDVIDRLLNGLPGLFQTTNVGEAAAGSAIKGACMALETTGGKVVCVMGSPPTLGCGKVERLDDTNAIGTDREKKFMSCDNAFWMEQATLCTKTQVTVDLIACTSTYADLASIGTVCRVTGGQMSYIPRFDYNQHSTKLRIEISRIVCRPTGFEGVLRVRCSSGLAVQEYFGAFNKTLEGDIELPTIDADKALGVQLKLESDMGADRTTAAVQCAVLYTASDGTRRIRVHTISVLVTNNISTIFRSADLDAVINFTAKRAVAEPIQQTLDATRNQLIAACVQILYVYRKFCATNPAPGQLILPESLKLLPLYTLGLLKNKALTLDTAIVKTDERAYFRQRLLTLSAGETSTFVYPRLFGLHNMPPNAGYSNSSGEISLPPTMSLSAERLEAEGAYLVENGETMLMWLGKNLPKSFLQQVFDVHALAEGDAKNLLLVPRDNELSRRLVAIVDQIRSRNTSHAMLTVVQQKDIAEASMFSLLIEDRAGSVSSYVDFLCTVHSQIQSKML